MRVETFYLIDFENVNNGGIEHIATLSKTDHVHIFSTKNALKIRMDLAFSKNIDIHAHIVPAHKQSLDMHLVSYLGYLLGNYGNQRAYIIISKDTDYDDIIKFWKNEGYSNIVRKSSIQGNLSAEEKTNVQPTQNVNTTINAGMAYKFFGDDRSELNLFMQHGLVKMGYAHNDANKICKYVIAHCNDERMLSGIHNDLKREYRDYSKIYEDVKSILGKFATSKSRIAKRESRVRSFFGQHFRKKLYVDKKEKIITLILNAKSKQEINNGLMNLYPDGKVVRHIYQTIQPLLEELPAK